MPIHPVDILFLAALFVPSVMSIGGVAILLMSLVVKHYRQTHPAGTHVEARAH